MAILNFPNQQIIPRSPKTADYSNTINTSGTWYTILSVTSKSGILQRVIFGNDIDLNNNLEIRITVDGVANTLTTSSTSKVRSIVFDNTAGSPGSYNSPYSVFYESPIYFFTSLTIEVRANGGNNRAFQAICDYSLA
jgi:hypothetical protein